MLTLLIIGSFGIFVEMWCTEHSGVLNVTEVGGVLAKSSWGFDYAQPP